MQARGTLRRITTDDQVEEAVHHPPTDTRAWFRGECMRRYAEHIAAASWDSVIFDVPGHDALQRVPTLEPLRGTKAHVGDLLDRCPTAADLLVALNPRG
jgi:proteasome accessory factor A